ncbi:hypothetical protein [Aeromonas caviae]|uniref:hypothetical protein n=1 Tax=Aeromonas caviae TaxID=648 RepID=UPI0029D99746|nr:hypothetical protein [Aeromonas caviae]MDX7711813.1 hypothetical protein [Aeromonas caviae]
MRKTILLLLPVMMLLAGCGDNPEEKAQQLAQAKLELAQQELELRAKELELKEKELTSQQAVQQAAPAATPAAAPVVVNSGGDSGMTDVLLGAAVGGLVANALNTPSHTSYSAPQQIVHKTVIKKTVYQKPKPYKRPVTYKKPTAYKHPRPVISSYKPKRY